MAYTWKIDVANGLSTNGGDSWTADFTNTDGVANGTTTFTSATGGFTGKEGRWMWIQTKNVRRRIVTVNSNTSVVLDSSVTAGSGLTFTLGGCTSESHTSIGNGDTIHVAKSAAERSIGNATFTEWSTYFTLATERTKQIIPLSNFPWAAATNITTASTTLKTDFGACSITPLTAFGTGLIAYMPLCKLFTGGTITYDSQLNDSSAAAVNAFDNSNSTSWSSTNTSLPHWLKYDFGTGKTLTHLILWTGTTSSACPKAFTVDGSNDDSSWTTLYTSSGSALSVSTMYPLTFTATGSYRYYRIYVTSNTSGNTTTIPSLAYIDGAVDLSAYQQVQMWFRRGAATASGDFTLKLCSDIAGTTAVNTLTVPALDLLSSGSVLVTMDNGSALGNNILSVALYSTVDPGTAGIGIDSSMIATLVSSNSNYIGFDTIFKYSDDIMYMSDTIDGANVYLDCSTATYRYSVHVGSSETKGIYAITPTTRKTRTTVTFSSSATDLTVIGGWNTSTDSRDGITFISDLYTTGNSYVVLLSGTGLNLSYIGAGRLSSFLGSAKTATVSLQPMASVGGVIFSGSSSGAGSGSNNLTIKCIVGGYILPGSGYNTVTVHSASGFNTNLFDCGNDLGDVVTIGKAGSLSNQGVIWSSYNGLNNSLYVTEDISINAGFCESQGIGDYIYFTPGKKVYTTASYAWDDSSTTYGDGRVYNLYMQHSGVGATRTFIYPYSNSFSIEFFNLTLNGFLTFASYYAAYPTRTITIHGLVTDVEPDIVNQFPQSEACKDRINIDRYNGDVNDNRIYGNEGLCKSQTSVRHTSSGVAWQMSPMSAGCVQTVPLELKLGSFYLSADTTYTISAWMRRSNTGITGELVVLPELPGITLTRTAMTANADTWQEVSIEVTPTATGVLNLYVYAYGGTTYSVYVDDVSITAS